MNSVNNRLSSLLTSESSKQLKKSVSFSEMGHRHSSENYHTFLTNIIKCPLCTSKVSNARMCPYCCKLFCEKCLNDYIAIKSEQCPNCYKVLKRISIVNCQNLGKQIQQTIIKNQEQDKKMEQNSQKDLNSFQNKYGRTSTSTRLMTSSSEILQVPYVSQFDQCQSMSSQYGVGHCLSAQICPDHEMRYEYYCITCKTGVCSDCAVLTQKHQSHRMCKLSSQKLALQSSLQNLFKQITQSKHAVFKQKQQKIQLMEKLKHYERQKLQCLANYSKNVCNNVVNNQINSQIQQRQNSIATELINSYNQILLKYQRYNQILSYQSKSLLIKKYQEYRYDIMNVIKQMKKTTKIMQIPQREETQNRIKPEYDQKVFCLQNYTLCRNRNQMVYSDPFYWKGIEWRLKIYPNGLDNDPQEKQSHISTNKYLAVYLEMSKCQTNKLMLFNFKIQVINQIDNHIKISRTFQSQFDQGMCWGYDSFAKISTLYDEKYVHPTRDYLQIVLSVKYPTYFHGVTREKWFIEKRQIIKNHNLQKIRQLRKKLGIKCLQKQKIGKMGLYVKGLIDKQLEYKCKDKLVLRKSTSFYL